MKDNIIKTDDYKQFIHDVKQTIQSAQIKAAVSVNRSLLGPGRAYCRKAETNLLGRWFYCSNEPGFTGRIPKYERVFKEKSGADATMVPLLET